MKGFETGKDKIQKICDALKKETLDPAKQEAREIVENAHLQAAEIVKEAKEKGALLLKEAEKELEERKRIFQASLKMACRQGIDLLKEKIETALFDRALSQEVVRAMKDPEIITSLLLGMMDQMKQEGHRGPFIAKIPKGITPREINALLGTKILERLEGGSVSIGEFAGGAQVSKEGGGLTFDFSDGALRDLIAQFIRRDFRDMVFNS